MFESEAANSGLSPSSSVSEAPGILLSSQKSSMAGVTFFSVNPPAGEMVSVLYGYELA